MNPSDPTLRFTDRVSDYARYRPGYPAEILDTLRAECGLAPASVIADIGCGTGNLAKVFLDNGNTVIGVEPNAAMREAGARELAPFGHRFRAVDGRAEATGLPGASADLVTAGQAFHWFQPAAARDEFARILRPRGAVALVWNERRPVSAFLDEYETLLLKYAVDYARIRDQRNSAEAVEQFFAPQPARLSRYSFAQQFDYEGLQGRLLSSSYAPRHGDANYEPMVCELRAIFHKYAVEGHVAFVYETSLWFGRLD